MDSVGCSIYSLAGEGPHSATPAPKNEAMRVHVGTHTNDFPLPNVFTQVSP